jgi:uncharacterized repeat protein (TIGR03987 family)
VPIPAILITAALVFYSIATWSERLSGILKPIHLVLFWIGLIFDTSGTGLMIQNSTIETFSLHSLSGYAGIILMFIHTVWASVVLARNLESMKLRFHRFSITVWILWMFSYINGAVLGMSA